MIKENFLSKIYQRNGDSLYFGAYPQTEVSDSGLISALNNSVDALPTPKKGGEWTSYGYYVSGMSKDCMWYVDKEYEGKRYRGVYFTSYRPDDTTSTSCVDNSRQYDNGYALCKVYWFKFEPIKWQIVGEKEGKALLCSHLILDSQEFNSSLEPEGLTYPNAWEHSTIRRWLNESFFDLAFSGEEKSVIVPSDLDNKLTARTNEDGLNRYATTQNDTTDNLFLLSYSDLKKLACDSATLRKSITDYARIQGVSTSTDPLCPGKGWWWLRSPFCLNGTFTSYVTHNGNLTFNSKVNLTCNGVVPALTIKI